MLGRECEPYLDNNVEQTPCDLASIDETHIDRNASEMNDLESLLDCTHAGLPPTTMYRGPGTRVYSRHPSNYSGCGVMYPGEFWGTTPP